MRWGLKDRSQGLDFTPWKSKESKIRKLNLIFQLIINMYLSRQEDITFYLIDCLLDL